VDPRLGIVLTTSALLFLAGVTPAAAPPPPPAPWEAPVRRAIEQLGDREFSRRESAQRFLAAESERIIPILRAAVGNPNLEIRRRALRLLHSHEHAVLFSPRLVTLHVTKKPLNETLNLITKQTGYKFQVNGGGGPETLYSFDFDSVPFWDAMDRICRDANLTIPPYGDPNGGLLYLQPSAGQAPYTWRDGTFRFVANNFQLYRSLDLSAITPGVATNRVSNMTFGFNIHAEPRLPILGMGEVRLEAAYDNEKNSLLPPEVNNGDVRMGMGGRMVFSRRHYPVGNKQMSVQGNVQLVRVSEKATHVKVMRGSVPLTLLTEQKDIVVSDKILSAKGKKIETEELNIQIEEVQKQANGQCSIKMTITNNNKDNPGDYSWMNSLYQRIELSDEKGEKYQFQGTNWSSTGPNYIQFTMIFGKGFVAPGAKAGTPTKFTYQQWVTRIHEVNFEFHDVPLP
jgi:hypothetical protein